MQKSLAESRYLDICTSIAFRADHKVVSSLKEKRLVVEIPNDKKYLESMAKLLVDKKACQELESIELRGAESSKGSKNVDASSMTRVVGGVAQCLGYNPPSTNNNNETLSEAIPRAVEMKISNILSIEINSVALNKLQLEALNMGLDGNRSVREVQLRNVPQIGGGSGLLWSIAKGISGSNIASLAVVDCSLEDKDIAAILSILRAHQLKRDEELWTIDLRGNFGITTNSLRSIANSGLLALDLSGNNLTDSGALGLWKHLMHDRWLVGLSIRCNRIGDALKHLFSTCYIRDASARVAAVEGTVQTSARDDGEKTSKKKTRASKKKSKKSTPAFMRKQEPESEPLEEPLNLCGLLVDQREDMEVSIGNNKVDEYHTTVAHYRAWKDRLKVKSDDQSETESVAQEDLGDTATSVADLIGLLSPVDALCDDPIIAGAFKQFGINFDGEPPSPPVPRAMPRVEMERKNGVIVMKHTSEQDGEKSESLNNAARRDNKEEADKQDVQKICEDFGRLFASCNVKCGVPSVMISKNDFGDVLRLVRKELNKQQAFTMASSMLRQFRFKVMQEMLSKQFRQAGLYPNDFQPQSFNNKLMVYLRKHIEMFGRLMAQYQREEEIEEYRQQHPNEMLGGGGDFLGATPNAATAECLHKESKSQKMELEIQNSLETKYENGWVELWLTSLSTFGGGVIITTTNNAATNDDDDYVEPTVEMKLTTNGIMKELKRIALSMKAKDFDETDESIHNCQKFMGFNLGGRGNTGGSEASTLTLPEVTKAFVKSVGFMRLMRMIPDHNAVLYLINECIDNKFSNKSDDTTVRYKHASERLFDEWFSSAAHLRRSEKEKLKAELLERKEAMEREQASEKTANLMNKFRGASRKVDMLNAIKSGAHKDKDANKQLPWMENNSSSSSAVRMTMASSAELSKALYFVPIPSQPLKELQVGSGSPTKKKGGQGMGSPGGGGELDTDSLESGSVASTTKSKVEEQWLKLSEEAEKEVPLITVEGILFAREKMKVSEGDRLNSAKQKLEEQRNNQGSSVSSSHQEFVGAWRHSVSESFDMESINEKKQRLLKKIVKRRQQEKGYDHINFNDVSLLTQSDLDELDFLEKKMKYRMMREQEAKKLEAKSKKMKDAMRHKLTLAELAKKNGDAVIGVKGEDEDGAFNGSSKHNKEGEKSTVYSSDKAKLSSEPVSKQHSKTKPTEVSSDSSFSNMLTPPDVLLFNIKHVSQSNLFKKKLTSSRRKKHASKIESALSSIDDEVDIALRVFIWRLYSSFLPKTLVADIYASEKIGAFSFFSGSSCNLETNNSSTISHINFADEAASSSSMVSFSTQNTKNNIQIDFKCFDESLRKLRRVVSHDLLTSRRKAVDLGRDIYSALCEDAGLDLWMSAEGMLHQAATQEVSSSDVSTQGERNPLNSTVLSEATTVQAGHHPHPVSSRRPRERSNSSHKSSSAEGTTGTYEPTNQDDDDDDGEDDVYGEDFMAKEESEEFVKPRIYFNQSQENTDHGNNNNGSFSATPDMGRTSNTQDNFNAFNSLNAQDRKAYIRSQCYTTAKAWISSLKQKRKGKQQFEKKRSQRDASRYQTARKEEVEEEENDDEKDIHLSDFTTAISLLFGEDEQIDPVEINHFLSLGCKHDKAEDSSSPSFSVFSANELMACLEICRDWNGMLGALEKEVSWCSIILKQIDKYASKRRWRMREFFGHLYHLAQQEDSFDALHSEVPGIQSLSPCEFEQAISRMNIRGFSIFDLQSDQEASELSGLNAAVDVDTYPSNVIRQHYLNQQSMSLNPTNKSTKSLPVKKKKRGKSSKPSHHETFDSFEDEDFNQSPPSNKANRGGYHVTSSKDYNIDRLNSNGDVTFDENEPAAGAHEAPSALYDKLVVWVPLSNTLSSHSDGKKLSRWSQLENIVSKEPLDVGEQWLRRYVLLPYSTPAERFYSENGSENTMAFSSTLTVSSLAFQHKLFKNMKRKKKLIFEDLSSSENMISSSDFEAIIRSLKKYLPIQMIVPLTPVSPTRRSKASTAHVSRSANSSFGGGHPLAATSLFQEDSCVVSWLSGAKQLVMLSKKNTENFSNDRPLETSSSSTRAMHLKLTNFEISCGCEIKHDESGVGVSYRIVEGLISSWIKQSSSVTKSSFPYHDNENEDFDDDENASYENDFQIHQNGWFPFVLDQEIEAKLALVLSTSNGSGGGSKDDLMYDDIEEKEACYRAARDVALFVYLCVRAQVYDVQKIISCAFIAAPQLSLLCDELGAVEYELSCRNWTFSDIFRKADKMIEEKQSSSPLIFSETGIHDSNSVAPPPPPPVFDSAMFSKETKGNHLRHSTKNVGVSSFFATSAHDKPQNFLRHSAPAFSSSNKKGSKSQNQKKQKSSVHSNNGSEKTLDANSHASSEDLNMSTVQLDTILEVFGSIRRKAVGGKGPNHSFAGKHQNTQDALERNTHFQNRYQMNSSHGLGGDGGFDDTPSIGSDELLEQLESRVSHLDSLVHSLEGSCLIIDDGGDEFEDEEKQSSRDKLRGGGNLKTMRGGEFDITMKLRQSSDMQSSNQSPIYGVEEEEEEGQLSRSAFTKSNATNFSNLSDDVMSADRQGDESVSIDDGVLMSKLADALSNRIQSLYG